MTEVIERTEVRTPRGRTVTLPSRKDTADLSTIGATFELWGNLEDEYQTGSIHLDPGDVIVDVGAYIGTIALALLLDNPGTRAICVEPVPDNAQMIRAAAEVNDLTDRIEVIEAGIGTTTVRWDYGDFLPGMRYVGGLHVGEPHATRTATVPKITLAQLVQRAGGSIRLLKVDCEGCEWTLFRSKALGKVREIVGEWHGHAKPGGDGLLEIEAILERTHEITSLTHMGGTGTFRAVLR